MKKALLILIALSTVTLSAQTPWRTLTLGAVAGTTLEGKEIVTVNATLSYELKHGFSIESWTGLNKTSENQGWVSNQTTYNYSTNGWTMGAGMLYATGEGTLLNPIPPTIGNDNLFAVLVLRKRFNLNRKK
tara:strand:+ start:33 stop:425 length:393 start_codon:yes stop_codon:yes gene_type:complete